MPTYVDVRDYQRLYLATRSMEPRIRRAFNKRLRNAAKVGQQAAQEKIQSWPSHYQTGLRAALAANIKVSVAAKDVRIRQANIHRHGWKNPGRDIDRGAWRHPVYGHRRWVTQTGIHYFKQAIDSKRGEMLDQVKPVLDDVTAYLTGRGLA